MGEGREFAPLNLRQQHRAKMYEECQNLCKQMSEKLKEKIGKSAFLEKFYQIKRGQNDKANWRKDWDRKRQMQQQQPPSMKKRKLQQEEGYNEDWESFLWEK